MPRRPPKLDYASQRPASANGLRRRLIAGGICFGVSWLVWFALAVSTLDSFDDEWFTWVFFLVGLGGTLSGLVLFIVVHVVMEFQSRN